ncbi:hypothetical protein MKW94_011289 [Papaver nudicaule]|uniref:Uncharacterized protein n=1 Tax=Papaver nudicaule TaxID=74823 RepID=A0AA41VWS4_PAPNU|nr:hypothetical protein [Papaver nudicaule]
MLSIYRDEDLSNPSQSPTFLKLIKSSPRVSGEDQSHISGPISTPPKKMRNEIEDHHHQIRSRESSYCTTPTAKQHKIPEVMTCPPAPKKQRHFYVVNSAKAKKRSDYFIPPLNFEAIFLPDLTTKKKSFRS